MNKEMFLEFLNKSFEEGKISHANFVYFRMVSELLLSEKILITDIEQLLGLQCNKEYIDAEVSYWEEYNESEKPFMINYKKEFYRKNSPYFDYTSNIIDLYREKLSADSLKDYAKDIYNKNNQYEISYYENEKEFWDSYNLKCLTFIATKSFQTAPAE